MKKSKIIASFFLGGLLLTSMSGCSSTDNSLTLRILNSEDYIYVNDPDSGYDEPDLINQFEEYVKNTPELAAKYGKIKVVYDTADTMENIYSEMQTGKSNYDLICASDYIVAKMIRYGLVAPVDKTLVPNYFGNEEITAKAAASLTSRVNQIKTTPIQGDYKGKEQSLGDYTVGYMWGTLGFLFNPTYSTYLSQGISPEEVIEDMAYYDTIWHKYTNTISIKDSMRDTFVLGLMKAYHDSYTDKNGNSHPGFSKMRDKFYKDQSSEHHTYTDEQYNADFDSLFNYVVNPNADPNKVINDVVKELNELKKNIFGLEVDSGKQDIVTGKIGINWAWSGDAVYSMDQAEDASQVTTPTELYYSVPETGSNLWMDLWVTPKLGESKQSKLQWELAHEFLNYLCEPSIASKNMDYTGYTSFIAGDDILWLVRDWYDSRADEIFYGDEYFDIYAVDPSATDVTPETFEDENISYCLDYPDAVSYGHDSSIDEWKLYYYCTVEYDPKTKEPIEVSKALPVLTEEKIQKTYGDLLMFDLSEDYEAVDLTYFFNGTLDEYTVEDMIMYSDSYSYFTLVNEDGTDEICVGRQFYAQFPDENTLVRCAVMQDYQDYNDAIMRMWEDFKSDPLPIWAIVLFILLVVGLLFIAGYVIVNKHLKKRLRIKRREKEEIEKASIK